ncbi:MAG: hypothetical protein Udaeo2_12700 [Candidatus Udaeobacter sp.]|nr:MAG: hypothetical protein Udaeo2_12700 [Candidatus Udaeobacter sp.]
MDGRGGDLADLLAPAGDGLRPQRWRYRPRTVFVPEMDVGLILQEGRRELVQSRVLELLMAPELPAAASPDGRDASFRACRSSDRPVAA